MAPTLSRSLTESPQRAIGGQTLNALHNNIFSATSQPQIDYLYSYYNAVPHNAHFLTSTNLLLCRDRFNAIGGFDIAFPRAMGVAHTISDFYMLVAGTGNQIRTAIVLSRDALLSLPHIPREVGIRPVGTARGFPGGQCGGISLGMDKPSQRD